MSRLLSDPSAAFSAAPATMFAPFMAPAPGPSAPLGQGLTTEVVIALAVASFMLVGLFLGVARFLFLYLYHFEARSAKAAAAEAVEREAAEAQKHNLQRVTPIIVIQPNQEILYGLKQRPEGKSSPDVHLSAESSLTSAPPQPPPSEGAKSLKCTNNICSFYVVEIPALALEPPEGSSLQDIGAGEVLKEVQLAREHVHVHAHVCRDSVSSCQALTACTA